MNIMRRLLSSTGSSDGAGGVVDDEADGGVASRASNPNPSRSTTEQELLGLSHLKKLHSEYAADGGEKEEKLYAMLPLFCKVFASVGPHVISERFSEELPSFTKSTSRLLVTEVRRRASNQSTEEAAAAIANFMEVDSEEGGGNGWNLLSTLNLIVGEGDKMAEIMTNASLPSTLVKCLYLFFDLPELTGSDSEQPHSKPTLEDVAEAGDEESYTAKEKRLLLQKMFIKVLLRLCTHLPAVEELARKDDLTLLFSAVTSECPAYNVMWRKTAADILLTISRHSLSQPVISYLHSKGCIALCVENMQGNDKLTPLEVVEMFVTVFCFLKDSSTDSDTLLEDFRTCQGYIFLSEFLIRVDGDEQTENKEALRNLVLLIASLTFCGHAELKMPQAASSLYQLETFEYPEPQNKGSTVRNVLAFQVLQSVFLKCKSDNLGCNILDAVSTIYTADNANYFLLESLNFLPQTAEKIGLKSTPVQEKFFQLIEFIVHHLKHVPCKELIAISLILKAQNNPNCCILAVQSLMSIIRYDATFKNVFREVGMLEALIGCLKAYSESVKTNQSDKSLPVIQLGENASSALVELLSGNSQNATVFRDSDGVTITVALAKIQSSQTLALNLLQQLIIASGNEEDMTVLLELLQSSPKTNYGLRSAYLQCVIACLKESHRSRVTFRKCGGFAYIVSVFLSMDQSLSCDNDNDAKSTDDIQNALNLLRCLFVCLTAAMRYEPANAKYFHVEIAEGNNFIEAIQLLGCFSNAEQNRTLAEDLTEYPGDKITEAFREIFNADLGGLKNLREEFKQSLPIINDRLFYSCYVIRMLYDMAIDGYDKIPNVGNAASTPNKGDDKMSATATPTTRKKTVSLNLGPQPPEPVIVHASLINGLLKIMPTLTSTRDQDGKLDPASVGLQTFVAETLKGLLRYEKNQQIMCEVGFMSAVLEKCTPALENEQHVMHIPFQYLLERLAAQRLEPADLRKFLRLGNPLGCIQHQNGGFIPLSRVKTLVSMITPRDLHFQNNSTILPPFVELDMSSEGFGCLYIPSIAPTSAHSASVVGVSSLASQESAVIGGIGLGDRAFPPHPGLTFSTWVCIDKFSDPRSDPHPVRLLTLARTFKEGGNEESFVCLAVALSARDKALIVSANEVPLSKNSDWQPEFTGDNGVRIWFPDLIKEGEWHHVVFVLNRQILKNSTFSLFVNGQHISTQRMNYINPTPGASSSGGGPNITLASSVFAYIGTPPQWRRPSRLCWKQGPCMMFEDIATPQLASLLHNLGPHYLGSLQAPNLEDQVFPSQIGEDKIVFGLNAVAISQMTLAKIKKVYSKVDNKTIAKQLGMATGENATPIRVLHNSAGHLLGPARSLGGVIVGYLGVRVFNPQPVSKVIETVGGCHVMLSIIAMADNMESLYAGVKALVCVLKSNPFTRQQMEANRGYQTLAMLFRKKIHLLNSHILHLMFTMAGTIDASKEVIGIPNVAAFRDVLCDLELWHKAPSDLEKSLFEHFLELTSDAGAQRNAGNIKTLRDFAMVEKVLAILKISECSLSTTGILLDLIRSLLCVNPRVNDVLCFALFTAATLNDRGNEKCLETKLNTDGTDFLEKTDVVDESGEAVNVILLRNRCLHVFYQLLYAGQKVHVNYCEDVVQVVGFDWILLFLQGHLHQTTVVWGMRILVTLLSVQSLTSKFRMGSCNGHWLLKSDIVLQNKMVQALGGQQSTANPGFNAVHSRRGIRQDLFSVPGFQALNWLMPQHIEIPEMYFLLMAMVLGQPLKTLPDKIKLDLDSVWSYIFGSKASESTPTELSSKVNLSGDGMVTILTMVRTMLNYETRNTGDNKMPAWLQEYPVTLTQFLFYLYHNVADFMPAFLTSEVLTALAGTLFPAVISESSASTPENLPPESGSIFRASTASPTSGKSDDTLTNHPAKRNVLNFMKVLIVDSLSLLATQKNPPVIDLLIDANPENTSLEQRCQFQTELLGIIMEHLLAADILIGDQAALPVVAGGNSQYIAPNVFYLASRLVDKLWFGVIKKEPDEVFQFILKLISQAKRRSGGGTLTLEGIYRCLNRTILYMLSRPHANVAGQMGVLDVLHKIVDNRNIIFGAGNHELDFFGCLTYCLLRLKSNKNIPMEPEGKTTWHVSRQDEDLTAETANLHQGQNLLSNAASRVWELMYVSKKPALEEIFKISLSQQNATPPLDAVRDNVYDAAARVWFNYIDMEKKATFAKIPAWEFHTQLQSRIQRVTGGFTGGLRRLTSVGGNVTGGGGGAGADAKSKKEDLPKVEYSPLPREVFESSTANHISIVKEVVDQHYRNRLQIDGHMLTYTEEQWLRSEDMLTQERGIWGPFNESPLTKWMLDMTEGPLRMRKKQVRNENFYFNYPYQRRRRRTTEGGGGGDAGADNGRLSANDIVEDEDDDKPHKYKKPSSHDSKLWFEQHSSLAMYDRKDSQSSDQRIVEEYDDCDVTVVASKRDVNRMEQDIDDALSDIGFQGLKSVIAKQQSLRREVSEEDESEEANDQDSNNDQTKGTGTFGSGSDKVQESPQSPLSVDSSSGGGGPPPGGQAEPITEEGSSDYQAVMRLLEQGEKITQMYRCARIQGLDTIEGLLLFGKEHFYLLDGFTLVNGREVHDISCMPTTYYEPIIPQVPGQNPAPKRRDVFKYSFDSVKEVHKRRYLLQPIAVEVFCSDGQNQLLAFTKIMRPKVYQRFLQVSTSISDTATSSVAGQRRSANVEQTGGLFSSLMGETSVTQRWVRGEISNFQYLMALNTLAGRSYNDLMQYPVFPWVLANYESDDEPDFTDPANFRDLSKPMGAQTGHRLEQFKKRFQDWDDPQGDTPPYHYGTHYSSAMIVSSYLVRVEPFTQEFLRLQGGHFDLADRMFHSIDEAWRSASKNNMADVRELIPEFFYLPDFLENRNRFDIGTKQNGEALNDVLLPPWAKGCPAEFIRVHRAALESDYVSQHLHEWIDLIFGYKQQGPAATEAVNVYHHLFYEGNVDVFSIEDPLQRNATIGFINNFGQIPKQLFKKPHPIKRAFLSSAASSGLSSAGGSVSDDTIDSNASSVGGGGNLSVSSKIFYHHLTNLRPTMTPIKELKGPVGQIQHLDRVVYAVEQNKVLVPGSSNRYLAWGYADQSFRLGNYESDKAVFICEPSYLVGQVLTCVCPNSKVVLTAGTSSVVVVYEYDKKVKQLLIKHMLYGHTDAVCCLAASPAWSIAVSGSRDRTAIIWDLSRYSYVKHLPEHAAPIAAVTINEATGDIVTCAGSWLYVWDVAGRKLAELDTNTVCPPPTPQPKQQQILCVTTSQMHEWNRENVIMTGSSDGVVRMWSIDFVEVAINDQGAEVPASAPPPPGSGSSEPEADGADEDFVVVGNRDFDAKRRRHKSDGYVWKRKILFRAKLTMHTAYERPDNIEPAAVTALAISRDHKTIYVGDERGRVFSWSVASKPGKGMVDHWWKDEGVEACVDCGVKFTIYERRHHCRNCGKVFCSSCSQYQAEIPRLKIHQPVRVCKTCRDELFEENQKAGSKKK